MPDDAKEYVHIVGWGEDDKHRKNIHTIDTEGNAWFAGEVAGKDGSFVSKTYVDSSLAEKASFTSVSALSKRVANLEPAIDCNCYQTDAGASYEKDVPVDVLPYASVSVVGGMTHAERSTVQYDLTGLIGDTGSNGELTVTATSIKRADPSLSNMYR